MAPPPKRVDSVEVHNETSGTVTVTVVFDDHKEKREIADTADIAAGSSKHFEEQSLDMGSWQAIAPVKHVKVTSGASNSISLLTPEVSGVVKKLHFHVKAEGSGFKLHQGAES